MTRGPQHAPRGKGGQGSRLGKKDGVAERKAKLDLGLDLSVYGENREGELIEIHDATPASDDWPTEH